jgi:hypothetical protein
MRDQDSAHCVAEPLERPKRKTAQDQHPDGCAEDKLYPIDHVDHAEPLCQPRGNLRLDALLVRPANLGCLRRLLVDQLATAKRVIVEVEVYTGPDQEATFDVAGLKP